LRAFAFDGLTRRGAAAADGAADAVPWRVDKHFNFTVPAAVAAGVQTSHASR